MGQLKVLASGSQPPVPGCTLEKMYWKMMESPAIYSPKPVAATEKNAYGDSEKKAIVVLGTCTFNWSVITSI